MASWRKILQGVLLAGLLLAALAPPAAAERRRPAAQDELVAENETFQLYANAETLAIRVVDKRSGYAWHSNLPAVTEEDGLNRTWTAFATSGLSIDYLDSRAVDRRASISNAEHTLDFRRTDDGFEADLTFTEPSISLRLRVALEPAGVRVDVPFASVVEGGPFKLGLLHVYPFFGATRENEVAGYMFIPDGAGSLIRFAASTKARNMFYGRYYGTDLGMLGALPYDPTSNRPYRLSVPVSGMVHGEGQHAYLAVVESGAAYGQLQVHPAGVTTRFNFLHSSFIYNQSYFQATNRAGAGVTTIQPLPNAFDVTLHYRFLTGAESSYTGLARSYQQYLLERGLLPDVVETSGDIGVRLEFLGGEKERVLFWQRFIPMTTVSQMAAIVEGLEVGRPEVIYYGWQPLGANSMPPRSLRLDRRLGQVAELSELAAAVQARGGSFSLYLDPQAALLDQPGYSPRNDLALAITGVNVMSDNRQKVNYFLTLRELRDRYGRLSDNVFEAGLGLALDGLGSMLYSDFRRGHDLGRDEAVAAYQALLAEHPGPTAFYTPNDYMYGTMRAYYDMPLGSSGYLYTTEAVPFLQTVLAGYVPAYGPALNFSADLQADLLRHVDYNVYPTFYLSHETTDKFLQTSSNWIYTSAYTQWAPEVERAYAWLNDRLGPVQGQPIVAREQLAAEVFATTYGNRQQIIVNYGSQPFVAGADLVAARDAILREAP